MNTINTKILRNVIFSILLTNKIYVKIGLNILIATRKIVFLRWNMQDKIKRIEQTTTHL